MAVPVWPIVKKALVSTASNKKGRKFLLYVALITLFLLILPIVVILGIFTGGIDLSMDKVNAILQEKQQLAEQTMTEISVRLDDEGYSEQRIEEAQALYSLALFGNTDKDLVDKFVGCFEHNQTDDELVERFNSVFGMQLTVEQYRDFVQEIRDKYGEKEESRDKR